jgi:hypothetical protein
MLVVYLMAASIAIALYVEIPRVAFESQRNREELLMARGEQYSRAVELYYRKMKRYPQKLEDLENTNNFRFLRKRYKDPLTGKDEWRIIHMGPQGLTDSLVEKMPGLDADKDKDKSQVASNSGDPNKPPEEPTVDSMRTARDQRALAAQRGAGGAGANDPTAIDPAQQELMQQQLRQQQFAQNIPGQPPGSPALDPNTQNPGAPPSSVNVGPDMPNQQPPPQQPVSPFNQPNPNQLNNGFPGQNAPPGFPPIGSQNGPVRTLYPTGPTQPPFNPGNALIRGAIANPGAAVASSQGGGYNPGGNFPALNPNNNMSVPDAIRRQLTQPQQRPAATAAGQQNQQFGGAGIAGIASTATGSGIKRHNERAKYKEWEFVYDYRKPAKGAQKGVTGVGGLKTTDNPANPPSSFGGSSTGGFGGPASGGFGGTGSNGSLGSPRRP